MMSWRHCAALWHRSEEMACLRVIHASTSVSSSMHLHALHACTRHALLHAPPSIPPLPLPFLKCHPRPAALITNKRIGSDAPSLLRAT